MSLLDSIDKSFVQSVLGEIHETIKRKFYVFIKSKDNIESSNQDFNPVYGNTEDELFSNNEILEKLEMYGRIQYVERQMENSIGESTSTNLPISKGYARLKIAAADFEILKNSVKIEVDGDIFTLDSDQKNIGPFSIDFVTVFLRRE